MAYFMLAAVVFVISLVTGTHSPLRLLMFIFNGFGLIGLWGYLSDKAIGWRSFWAVYACLMLLAATTVYGPDLWHGLRHDAGLVMVLLASAIFTVPEWVAVWRYAFRSPHIWRSAPDAA